MTSVLPQNLNVVIRTVQRRDIEGIERLCTESFVSDKPIVATQNQLKLLRRWYGLLKFLNLFPNPLQYHFCIYVAEQAKRVQGTIQISPCNRTRSTWRVERLLVDAQSGAQGVGSALLRHCFEMVGEARTWLLEVDINDKDSLAVYRQNGFQTLAQQTYWEITPSLLQELALREPDLPNLLPVSNADAQLLYQLDTASMPPLVRQVFDRNADDFKTSLLGGIVQACQQWLNKLEVVSGYVFEPQRKAAIGYFQIRMCRQGTQPHVATLTVHPAYTWLYPELLSQLARIAQDLPPQSLQLASADYQQEREDYLEQIGAKRVEHTLMMSRSVYHKLRESKFASLEGLQWSEMLQGFQPARKPVAGGMSWIVQPKQQLFPIEVTSIAPKLTPESSSYSNIEPVPPSELGNQ